MCSSVSLIGSVCITLIPTCFAQSTRDLRSSISPMPQLFFVRSAKTGTTHPANFGLPVSKLAEECSTISVSCLDICGIARVLFNPSSHVYSPVTSFLRTNLYSQVLPCSFSIGKEAIHLSPFNLAMLAAFSGFHSPISLLLPQTYMLQSFGTLGITTLIISS